MTFVHLVADYGPADPAFSEVAHRLAARDPEVTVHPTAVPPFSTVATGFWIEQLACHNPAFEELIVYSNTAPRTEATTPGRADAGGELCYLELDTGVPVVAVDAGYNLSFVRDRIREFHTVETPATGSQFRSRDHFPERVLQLAAGNTDSLGERRSIEDVPPRPRSVVCHVDGYGNVKTSIRASELDAGDAAVTAELGGRNRSVDVAETVGDVDEGAVALVPGSAGGDDPYLELIERGGSAAAAFGHPTPGDELTVR